MNIFIQKSNLLSTVSFVVFFRSFKMPQKKVSLRQLELIITFMEGHRDFAVGRVRSKEGRAVTQRLWEEVAGILNAEVGKADYRTPKEWNKFYNDYKCRIKTKVRKIRSNHKTTGGGTSNVESLTPLEERLCAILGSDISDPLPAFQDPLELDNTVESQSAEYLDFEILNHSDSVVESDIYTQDEIPNIIDSVFEHWDQPSTSTAPPLPPQKKPKDSMQTPSAEQKAQKKKRKHPSEDRSEAENAAKINKTEMEKSREMLIDVERKRLELQQAQIDADKHRNRIELLKVEAINKLAEAAMTIAKVILEKSKKNRSNKSSPQKDLQDQTEWARWESSLSDSD